MPAWLLILLAMVAVVLSINPEAEAYGWYQSLRRPDWLRFHLWIPVLWLPLYGCLYLSAVSAWEAARRLPLMLAYGVLLVLLEGTPWLLCRTRRLGLGAAAYLADWIFALALATRVGPVSPSALLLLLPLLLWLPVEAWGTWSLLRLNAAPVVRSPARPPR